MLPADLVRARRRGDKLHVASLSGKDRQEATEIAESLLSIARESVGMSAEEVSEALCCVDRASRHEKLWAGLKKLVLDECEFVAPLEIDSAQVRKLVFERASAVRSGLSLGQSFERESILAGVAAQLETEQSVIEQGLFGDLKGAQTLSKAPSLSAHSLVERYELAQVQGVLLRAVKLQATVVCHNPDAYRQLFFKLKFRQLLYRLTALESGGYLIDIEGPFSLFESVTKYGLQLSLIVPVLLACDEGVLQAELRWGKERRALSYSLKWGKNPDPAGAQQEDMPIRSEVAALLKALERQTSDFDVSVANELLDIPGQGLCVPDLKFERPGHHPVYLEVLGFWSRDAVWKRIEWAQAGGHERVVFAVSSRLRVHKDALPEGNEASLYVYKGAMSAKTVLSQVEALAART